jgi:hypothetical protein
VVLALALLGACGDDGGTEVLECTGTCSCVEETRTCSCTGGSDCVVAGARDVTLICEGNAVCDLECDELCAVECPGTAGCTALIGPDSSAVCNGTGSCDYTCEGDCTVDCPGSSQCIVRCGAPDAGPAGTCTVTSCRDVVDCGGGIQACRTACPAP